MMTARLSLSVLLVSLALVALILLLRRLSGALVTPLDFVPAIATGLLIAFGTWSLRRLESAIVPDQPQLLVGICAVTWLLVVGLTVPGTSPLAGLALWLPVIATEAYWRVVPMELGSPAGEQTCAGAGGQAGRRPENGSTADVVQRFIRTCEEGCERIHGTVRINFAFGEQTAAQHIMFCPPLQNDPEVEIETADVDGVTVRATECRSYGLRLEARRGRDTAESLTVRVNFEAVST